MLNHFSFFEASIPDEYVDETAYKFQDAREESALSISFETRQPSVSLDALLGTKIERVKITYPDVIFGQYAHARSAIGPTITVSGTLEATYVHLACIDAGNMLPFLSLVSSHGGMRETMDIATRTASFERRMAQPVGAGFARRGAGRLTVEIPAAWTLPVDFRFSSRTCVIEMHVGSSVDLESTQPTGLVSLGPGDTAELLVVDPERELGALRGSPNLRSWRVKRRDRGGRDVSALYVHEVALRLAPAIVVRVLGRADASDAEILREGIREIVDTSEPVA